MASLSPTHWWNKARSLSLEQLEVFGLLQLFGDTIEEHAGPSSAHHPVVKGEDEIRLGDRQESLLLCVPDRFLDTGADSQNQGLTR